MRRSVEQHGKRGWIIVLASLPLMIAGCSGGESGAQGHGGAQGGAPMAAPVTVTPAIQKTVQPFAEWTGRFEAPESVEIRARITGTIERVHFKAGQHVQRGEVLFTIDPAPYQAELAKAEAQLVSAKTQAEWAKAEAVRSKKLLDAKAASQQEFDQLHAQERNTGASVKAAEAAVRLAKLNLDYTTIRSPINGRVSRTLVTAGNLIAVGTPVLTTVVSIDQMHVYFAMSEQSYLKSIDALTKGGAIPVSMGLANEVGTPHKGTLDFIDNRVSTTTGTVQARAVFQNSGGHWMPGLFAHIKVPEGAPAPAIMVPDRAIGTDQSKKVVWVVTPDNKAVPRDVVPGILVDGQRVVTSGLKVGEQVIIEGVQRVQPGMPVKPELIKVEEAPQNEAAPSQHSDKAAVEPTAKPKH